MESARNLPTVVFPHAHRPVDHVYLHVLLRFLLLLHPAQHGHQRLFGAETNIRAYAARAAADTRTGLQHVVRLIEQLGARLINLV